MPSYAASPATAAFDHRPGRFWWSGDRREGLRKHAIAGLPVQVGLGTCFVPLLICVLCGSSRALSISTTLAIRLRAELAPLSLGRNAAALVLAALVLAALVSVALVSVTASEAELVGALKLRLEVISGGCSRAEARRPPTCGGCSMAGATRSGNASRQRRVQPMGSSCSRATPDSRTACRWRPRRREPWRGR